MDTHRWRRPGPGGHHGHRFCITRRNGHFHPAAHVDHLHPAGGELVPDRPLAGTFQFTNHIQSKAALASAAGHAAGGPNGIHLTRYAFKQCSAAIVHPYLGRQRCTWDIRLARRLGLDQPAQINLASYESALDAADQANDRYKDDTAHGGDQNLRKPATGLNSK